MSRTMIEVRGLVKSFGSRSALWRLDLEVIEGERFAVAGPNGAGKTTLVRILAGLSRPTAGTVRIGKLHPARSGEQIPRPIGYVSHQPLVHGDLSAGENLRFYRTMYDVPHLHEEIDELMLRVGLARRRHDLLRTYSQGMKQRLAIARALLHDPPILLLDEPHAGLDSQTCARAAAPMGGFRWATSSLPIWFYGP